MLHVCGVYLLRFCCAYSNVYIYLFIGVNDMYQYSFYANKCIGNVPENPAALRAGTHSRTRREQFSSSVRRRQVMLQQQTGHVPCFMSGDLLTYSSSSLRSLHFVHVGMGATAVGSCGYMKSFFWGVILARVVMATPLPLLRCTCRDSTHMLTTALRLDRL